MSRAIARSLALLIAAATLGALAPVASAAPAPAWSLNFGLAPSNLDPEPGNYYFLRASNIGAAPTAGPVELNLSLPAELTADEAHFIHGTGNCSLATHEVTCEVTKPIIPGADLLISVFVDIAGNPSGNLTAEASVGGGGALQVNRTSTSPVQPDPVGFGFAPGLQAPLTAEDGSVISLAGSHPYQQTVSFGFTSESPRTEAPADGLTNSGHPKTVSLDLPPGLIGNPTATPLRCTEAQLESPEGCPDESAVGLFELTSTLGSLDGYINAIYNMVPPPGYPAALAVEVGGVGYTLHILASVRSDGDYGIRATTPDVLALFGFPFLTIQTQIWGDPSDPIHDAVRGPCGFALFYSTTCPVDPQATAFWTLPGHCPGEPDRMLARAESWEAPGQFIETDYESADLAGNPVSVSGCNQIPFEPTISVQPTTNLADSPSGLDVTLHQPTDTDLEHRSPAQLRDAAVTLPEGMVVNPSQANGRQACSVEQIGLATPIGASPIHFDQNPAACPDASKLGTVTVTTPLLAEYTDAGAKLATDPETGDVIPRPLQGSVYLAAPFENPFDSLLAIYLTVNDPESGTVAKFAGEVESDPQTGRLTTYFDENPQLPVEDIKLHLYGGARGALITPPSCGVINPQGQEEPHTTTTTLTPWTAPEAPDAHPTSSFQITAAPSGGPCPRTAGGAPNAPSFAAGTVGRQAGAYSPFAHRLSREDGSQRLIGFDTLLPPGLVGRLAGIPACSEAALAQAASRSGPGQGIAEQNDPSCPAASALGTVAVAAGAGPTPFHTTGTVYLTGPYKSAPLSVAVITPAIAGPFDLGTVVVRAALNVDKESAQVHAVSDPFPTILHGIPLDLRSVSTQLDRPAFVLNPTSCDPMAISGAATSIFGQSAPLNDPFQVGGCPELPFKPKLSLKLKGAAKRAGNPALIATLKARPGEANIARGQVKLPSSAFLDNSHIKTICTRVQFAADTCPPGSIYGKAQATTPLLDYTLAGPVYLRSSSNPLPDLVVKLKGPSHQPFEIDLVGRTDSVNGALRNTFDTVPDAPVTSFRLELFGGKRGLVENSRNLCRGTYRATVKLDGQNGKAWDTTPVVGTSCGKKGKKKPRHGHRRGGR